jgi:hypothetical protein
MYLPEGSVYPDLSTGHGWSVGNCIRSSWLWIQITAFFAVTPTDNFTLHISSHSTLPSWCTIDHTFLFFLSKNLKKELTYFTFTKSYRYSCRYAIIFSSPLNWCICLQSCTSDLQLFTFVCQYQFAEHRYLHKQHLQQLFYKNITAQGHSLRRNSFNYLTTTMTQICKSSHP